MTETDPSTLQKIMSDDPPPPFERKISGVPDYQTEYSRGCAPTAAGCVLGFHENRGYGLLIDGGDKYTRGNRDPGGYGYLHTNYDELGSAMGWIQGWGTEVKPNCHIWVGIRDVCNSPTWENRYNFTVTHLAWSYDPSTHYNTIKSETIANRPMVYTLRYPTYGGGSRYHSVTLIGYGCLVAPPEYPSSKNIQPELFKPATLYEYVYICHDNNTSTGEDVYLWWSQFIADSHIDRVRPGMTLLSNSQIYPDNINCWNYPNPFNPATTIYYNIAKELPVTITIFNLTGQVVYTSDEGIRKAGLYSINWHGNDVSGNPVAGGIYFYRLTAGNFMKIGKMTLMR